MGHPARTLLLAALVGASALLVLPAPAPASGSVTAYMTGLNVPIALAFPPDGRVFFAERNTGAIRIIENGTLLAAPYFTLPNTATAGERGLLGLALDPAFPANPFVYAYQTYADATNRTVYNRIVRIQGGGDTGLSSTVIAQLPPLSAATNHNGGVIAFGPDGRLYAVVGENANPAWSQDLRSPLGKVLRMNPDGSPPTDNPFYGNASVDDRIFTYGHRNMFGLAFHPITGRVYVTENGPACNDEINLLTPGRNYGWGPTETCTTPPSPPNNTNRDGPNPVLPIWWWGATICPTNAAIYAGPAFPAWQGDLLMGDCNYNRLHRLHLVGPAYDTVASDDILWTAPSLIMDVEEGRDGAIWFTTPTTIYRFHDTSQPPVPAFTATPPTATAGTPVAFNASASFDPDGVIVSYAWDFGDTANGTGVVASHAYAAPGTYAVTLTVVDNETYTRSVSHPEHVVPSPAPPVASFTATPAIPNPGAEVTFNGSGSTDPGGTIVAYAWEFGDGATGAGVIANYAYATPGRYFVNLTVTDNRTIANATGEWIRVNAPPVVSFTADPPQSYMGLPIRFTSTVTDDGAIVAYAWDFGDGTTGAGAVADHTYAKKGPFRVVLTVTDDGGLSTDAARVVLIANRPPEITYALPLGENATVAAASTLTLNVTARDSDGDALTYVWQVDGVTVATGLPAFDFSSTGPGTYRVTVTVSDGAAQVSHGWTVTVAEPAPASPLPWIAAGLLAAVVLSLFAVLLWRRRRRRDAARP